MFAMPQQNKLYKKHNRGGGGGTDDGRRMGIVGMGACERDTPPGPARGVGEGSKLPGAKQLCNFIILKSCMKPV